MINKISLTFRDSQIEHRFCECQHKIEFAILQRQLILIVILGILVIVNSFLIKNYLNLVLTIVMLILFLLIIRIGKNSPRTFNFLIFILQLFLNILQPISTYYFPSITNLHQIYFQGLGICYISFSQLKILLGTYFILKAAIILLNCFQHFFFIYLTNNSFEQVGIYFFIIYILMALHFLYMIEKDKRWRFMLENQKNQFDNIFYSQINFGVIKCKFNKRRNNAQFQKANTYAADKFKIVDDEKMKEFMRKMKINNINYYQIINFSINSNSQVRNNEMTLEEFIHQLFTQTQMVLQLNERNTNDQFNFEGIYEKNIYSIKISLIFAKIKYVLIVVEKSKKSTKKMKSAFQLRIAENMFNQLYHSTELYISNTLKSLNFFKMDDNVFLQKYGYHLKYLIQAKFWQFILLNKIQNQFVYFYGVRSNVKITQFTVKQEILDILVYLIPLIKYKKIEINLSMVQNIRLQTSKDLFRQLIMNFLLNSLQHSMKRTFIYIKSEQRFDANLQQNLIDISIENIGKQITSSTLSGLPTINPKFIKNLLHISMQHKVKQQLLSISKLKLGLPSAIQILQYIGSSDTIEVKQTNRIKIIRISLLQNLQKGKMLAQKDIDIKQKINIINSNQTVSSPHRSHQSKTKPIISIIESNRNEDN